MRPTESSSTNAIIVEQKQVANIVTQTSHLGSNLQENEAMNNQSTWKYESTLLNEQKMREQMHHPFF